MSRTMLPLHALEMAEESEHPDRNFAASDTRVESFLKRGRLALCARTRQGQKTPLNAEKAATEFGTVVMKAIANYTFDGGCIHAAKQQAKRAGGLFVPATPLPIEGDSEPATDAIKTTAD
ncbi:TPA: hypothetical protein N0F65_007074 [Lagenidium giganteum]|uniref:Uncharacterized protein n=1 Tax=Lagenidium giganteum TaxID=4803 RepID=A0AAV2YSN6_9STRA|nr:TPA: hypothetical protein N0F65_007074 [Lagenidium giganteum]